MIWLARAGTPVATTLQPLEPVELRVLHVVAPTLELDGEAVRTVSACLEDDEVRRAQGGRGEEAKATTPRCRRHANGLGVEVQDGIVVAVQLSPRDELLVRLLVRLAIVRAARSLPRRLHRDRRGGIDGRPAPARLKPRPDHRFFYGELPSRLRREHTPSRPLRGRNHPTLEDLHIPANLLVFLFLFFPSGRAMAGQWLAFLAAAGMAGRIKLRTLVSSPSSPEALGGSGRGERAHYPREPRRRPGADATKMLTPCAGLEFRGHR